MSIELITKDACGIEIERKGNRINILLVENEPVDELVVISAEERIEFLTPWINMLIHHKKRRDSRDKASGKEAVPHGKVRERKA